MLNKKDLDIETNELNYTNLTNLLNNFDFKNNPINYQVVNNKIRSIQENALINKIGTNNPCIIDIFVNYDFYENILYNYLNEKVASDNIDKVIQNLLTVYVNKYMLNQTLNKSDLSIEFGDIDTWLNLVDSIYSLSNGETSLYIKVTKKLNKIYSDYLEYLRTVKCNCNSKLFKKGNIGLRFENSEDLIYFINDINKSLAPNKRLNVNDLKYNDISGVCIFYNLAEEKLAIMPLKEIEFLKVLEFKQFEQF